VRLPIVLDEPPKRLLTDYRIGLSAWTDRSMVEEGNFYPYKSMSAEERLWWYSRFFDVVEVNSSFYAVPSVETTETWVRRTPSGFLFNVKAYALLTGHQLDLARVPDELRKTLPAAVRGKRAGRVPSAAFDSDARRPALGVRRAAAGAPTAPAGRQARVRAVPARPVGETVRRILGDSRDASARASARYCGDRVSKPLMVR
jgi:hypothetical protein